MLLFAICINSFVKYLHIFASFFSLIYRSSLCILHINPSSDMYAADVFLCYMIVAFKKQF